MYLLLSLYIIFADGAKLSLCYILKDGNLLHPLAVTLLVSLARVKSTVKYIICVITVSTVMFKLSWAENCIQLMFLFLKIEFLRKCVNGSAWTSYLKLENSMSFSIQIQAPRFVFRANSKSTKLEILKKLRPNTWKTHLHTRA